MSDWARRLRSPWVPVAVLTTLVTIVLVGGVVLTLTPVGCKVGFGVRAQSCTTPKDGSTAPVAAASATPSSAPVSAPGNPPASSYPPVNPGASSYPPVNPGASSYPPVNPGASSYPPIGPSTSSVYPVGDITSGPQGPASLGLNCRLPVYAGPPGSGGFLVFPGATFVADPRSDVRVPAPASGQQSYYGLTYDHALARWLPVPRNWVAPDGRSYAYPDAQDGVYVVNAADGTQTEIAQGHRWNVVDVEAEGIYATIATTGPYGGPPTAGLWLLPFGGSPRQLTNAGYWQAAGGGAAYGTETSAVPYGATAPILRLDLKTLAVTTWFRREGGQGQVVGFDGAGPVILVNVANSPNEVWIVGDPNSPTLIWVQYGGAYYINPPVVADAHGVWFSGNSTYLFVRGQAFYRVSTLSAQIAGGCAS